MLHTRFRCGVHVAHIRRIVHKSFRVKETKAFEFLTEVFNLFNFNPDPGTLDLNLRNRLTTFGKVGGGVSGITTRVIQLGAKFNF